MIAQVSHQDALMSLETVKTYVRQLADASIEAEAMSPKALDAHLENLRALPGTDLEELRTSALRAMTARGIRLANEPEPGVLDTLMFKPQRAVGSVMHAVLALAAVAADCQQILDESVEYNRAASREG